MYHSEKVNNAIGEFKWQSDKVNLFIDEFNYTASDTNKVHLSDLYKDYKQFCQDDGYKPLGKNKFSKNWKTKNLKNPERVMALFVLVWLPLNQIILMIFCLSKKKICFYDSVFQFFGVL
ncbi:primase-like DNA-binding domain-containing protein [Chryseobacterium sp. 7]|uniref:primase-like DNA-binding domain-containing protein n=1 Tax=Chryseobacterium sp. 7 TaxID=2035214 RepID=UPI000EB17793